MFFHVLTNCKNYFERTIFTFKLIKIKLLEFPLKILDYFRFTNKMFLIILNKLYFYSFVLFVEIFSPNKTVQKVKYDMKLNFDVCWKNKEKRRNASRVYFSTVCTLHPTRENEKKGFVTCISYFLFIIVS